MTLWHLLIGAIFVEPAAGAIAALEGADRNGVGIAAVIAAAVALGVIFAWSMHAIGRGVLNRFAGRPAAESEWAFRLLHIGGVVWAITTFIAGFALAGLLIRLVDS